MISWSSCSWQIQLILAPCHTAAAKHSSWLNSLWLVVPGIYSNAMHSAAKPLAIYGSYNQHTISLWLSKSTGKTPNICAVTIWGTVSIHVWIKSRALFFIPPPKLHYCCIRITNKLKTWSNRQLYQNNFCLVSPLAVFTCCKRLQMVFHAWIIQI